MYLEDLDPAYDNPIGWVDTNKRGRFYETGILARSDYDLGHRRHSDGTINLMDAEQLAAFTAIVVSLCYGTPNRWVGALLWSVKIERITAVEDVEVEEFILRLPRGLAVDVLYKVFGRPFDPIRRA